MEIKKKLKLNECTRLQILVVTLKEMMMMLPNLNELKVHIHLNFDYVC